MKIKDAGLHIDSQEGDGNNAALLNSSYLKLQYGSATAVLS